MQTPTQARTKPVHVTVQGLYEDGYTISIKPWVVRVSQGAKDNIKWTCSGGTLKIHYKTPGHFPGHDSTNCDSGPLEAKPAEIGERHSYTVTITTDDGVVIPIDPDYRIDR